MRFVDPSSQELLGFCVSEQDSTTASGEDVASCGIWEDVEKCITSWRDDSNAARSFIGAGDGNDEQGIATQVHKSAGQTALPLSRKIGSEPRIDRVEYLHSCGDSIAQAGGRSLGWDLCRSEQAEESQLV